MPPMRWPAAGMYPVAPRVLTERARWAKSRLVLDAATSASPSGAEQQLGSAVALLAALAAEVGAEPPLPAAREAVVPAWVQVQARRAPLPLRAARERVVPVRAERARPPRDQVTRRRLAPIEGAPVQLVRPPPAVGRPGPAGPLAPRRPLTPPARRVRQAPPTRPQPTKPRPTARAQHPTQRARYTLKVHALARHPTLGLPEAIRLPPGSALYTTSVLSQENGEAASEAPPPGFPKKPPGALAGERIFV